MKFSAIKNICAVLGFLLVSGCAGKIMVGDAETDVGQTKRIYKNVEYVVSEKKDSIAVAGVINSPCSTLQRLRIELLVENFNEKPVDFFPGEISAAFNGTNLKIFSYSELVSEIRTLRNNRMVLRGRGLKEDDGSGIFEMYYDSSIYPAGNLNPESGRYFGSHGKNSVPVTPDKEGSGIIIQSVMYLDDFDMNKLGTESMTDTVLYKNRPYSGIVVADIPEIDKLGSGGIFDFDVKIGEDIHRFRFRAERTEK